MEGLLFSSSTPVSSTNKTDRHDITEILLKMVLNTITLNPVQSSEKTRKNCFKYLKLMSPLKAAICTTISYTL